MVSGNIDSLIDAEHKTRALRDILESETFARSDRLKSLLRYLCEAEIEGRESELNEYSIATIALGRPKDFAPLDDSSVRSRAYELRQKLDKYYAHEAPSSPVRIELRKGSYVPRFCAVRAAEDVPALAAPAIEETPVAPRPKRAFPAGAVWFAGGIVCAFALLTLWSATGRPGTRIPGTRFQMSSVPSPWTSELESLWQPFIDNGTPLIIAFETRFFVRMGPLVVRDSKVNSLANAEKSEPLIKLQNFFAIHQLYASGNYTDVGTPPALFYLTRLLSSRVPLLSVRNSNEMTASDLRDSNVIFLGKPGLDPHIEKALSAADLVDLNGRVAVRNATGGEQSEYTDRHEDPSDPDSWTEKYSVISVIPGRASGRKILALTASGSEHPAALAYYLTQPDTVRELVKHLKSQDGKVLNYFQVLVRSEFKGKSLVKVEYVTHRVLKRISGAD